jgi:predicted ABC-type ATPase
MADKHIYLNDNFEPVDPESATLLKIIEPDGRIIFATPAEPPVKSNSLRETLFGWIPRMLHKQGGKGSGNFGHSGLPGKHGGSRKKGAGGGKFHIDASKTKKGFITIKDEPPTPVPEDTKKYIAKKRLDSKNMESKIKDLKRSGSFYSSIDGSSPGSVEGLKSISDVLRLDVPADRMDAALIGEYTSQYYEVINQPGYYLHGWIGDDKASLEIVSGVKQQGGKGSGNFGHSGLPGKHGGSRPKGAGGVSGDKPGLKSYQVRKEDADRIDSYLYSEVSEPILEKYGMTPEEAKAEIDKAREIVANMPSTKSLHVDKDGNYTAERQKLHDSIVDEFLSKGESVDDPTLLLTGGLPGSGKSTMLSQSAYDEYTSGGYVIVDSDEIKHKLAKFDGLDKVTVEAAAYHEESNDVLSDILRGSVPKNMNIIYDSTMKSPDKMERLVGGFVDAGYNIEIAFSEVPPEVAMSRAVGRYLGGGRFVDPSYISTHDHKNPKTAKFLQQYASTYRHWDNNVPFGEPPILVEEIIQ